MVSGPGAAPSGTDAVAWNAPLPSVRALTAGGTVAVGGSPSKVSCTVLPGANPDPLTVSVSPGSGWGSLAVIEGLAPPEGGSTGAATDCGDGSGAKAAGGSPGAGGSASSAAPRAGRRRWATAAVTTLVAS